MTSEARNTFIGIDFGCHSIYCCMINGVDQDSALSTMKAIPNCYQKDRRIL